MIFPWRRRARRTFPRRGAVRRPSRDTAPRRAIDTRDGAPATVSGAGLYRAFDNRTHNCMGCEWRDPAVINLFLSSVEGAWLIAMERLMGMLLVMVAVQMLLNGLRVFLPQR